MVQDTLVSTKGKSPRKSRAGHQNRVAVRAERPPVARSFRNVWIYAALFLATLLVYSQVREFSFVNYDDPDYIGNPHVRGGITRDGLVWAFTSGEAANWFPITRLSHLLDIQLFGMQSGWHHLTSAVIHTLTTLLVFGFLHRSTGARWRSALVAFLFALHPLHVESVAWVAERKDVLCAFFWFLTLRTYVRYAERPSRGRYLWVFLPFCLGLMSKPMIVTLPFVLLLLDAWPLRRLPFSSAAGDGQPLRTVPIVWRRAVCEKLPFIALSAGGSIIAYLTQRAAGAIEMRRLLFPVRFENALISYIVYLAKMVWPTNLAVFYPYSSRLSVWQAVFAGLTIAIISALVLRSFRAHPQLAVGWLWYLVTLTPVIGLVQVGMQARADRYMYIPMVGPSIMLAWGAASLVMRWPRSKALVVSFLAAACTAAVVVTWLQIRYWNNSESIFRQAIKVTDGNYQMHFMLGQILTKIPGRLPEAISEYQGALRIKPDYLPARINMAIDLELLPGRLPEAIAEYEAALRVKRDSFVVHNNLGAALAKLPGRLPEAIAQFEAALSIKPDYVEARYNLGVALSHIPARLPDAIAHLEAVLRIRPDPAVRQMLDRLRSGRIDE
jgi:tetratricopeptide (TPR) repeat protein